MVQYGLVGWRGIVEDMTGTIIVVTKPTTRCKLGSCTNLATAQRTLHLGSAHQDFVSTTNVLVIWPVFYIFVVLVQIPGTKNGHEWVLE